MKLTVERLIEKRAYSVREFCHAFSISKPTFFREVAAGYLRKVKLDSKTLVLKEDADKWASLRLRG